MKELEKVLKERKMVNEFGRKATCQLVKRYKECDGRERETTYIYIGKYDNETVPSDYRVFKRLSDAEDCYSKLEQLNLI